MNIERLIEQLWETVTKRDADWIGVTNARACTLCGNQVPLDQDMAILSLITVEPSSSLYWIPDLYLSACVPCVQAPDGTDVRTKHLYTYLLARGPGFIPFILHFGNITLTPDTPDNLVSGLIKKYCTPPPLPYESVNRVRTKAMAMPLEGALTDRLTMLVTTQLLLTLGLGVNISSDPSKPIAVIMDNEQYRMLWTNEQGNIVISQPKPTMEECLHYLSREADTTLGTYPRYL